MSKMKVSIYLMLAILVLSLRASIILAETGGKERIEAGYDLERLLELRPPGSGSGPERLLRPEMELIPENIIERIKNIPHISSVEKYLFLALQDKTKDYSLSIIAGNSPAAIMRVDCHNVQKVRIASGRAFNAADEGQRVAIVGVDYAKKYAPAGLQKIPLGATISLIGQTVEAAGFKVPGDSAVRVVGIFSSGFSLGDNQVLLPLDTAQKMFGLEGRVSKIFITVESAEARDEVQEAILDTLDESIDVLLPRRLGMTGYRNSP